MSKVIGKGAHGIVCQIIEDGKHVAVKKIKIDGSSTSYIALEVSMMCTYDHPHLNRCSRVEIGSDDHLLLYQGLADCDLSSYIKSTADLDEELARSWMRSIVSALLFLKCELIVHGDIKPANILVYKDLTVKLTDFGCCAILENEYVVTTSGTTKYSSPETLLKSILSHAGDIWSLGCVVYEMLARQPLIPSCSAKHDASKRFRTAKSIQAWRRTCGDNIGRMEDLGALTALPISFCLDGEAAELINSMLCYRAGDRVTIEELACHEWLGVHRLDRTPTVCCNMLDMRTLSLAMNHVESYLVHRSLVVPESVTMKTASIYARTKMEEEIEIEAALVIALRMFRTVIKDYHPISSMRLLNKRVLNILVSNGYRIHKHSMSELYIKLGHG